MRASGAILICSPKFNEKNGEADYFLRNGMFTWSWKCSQGYSSSGKIFGRISVVFVKPETAAGPFSSPVFISCLETEVIIRITNVNMPEIINLIVSNIKL